MGKQTKAGKTSRWVTAEVTEEEAAMARRRAMEDGLPLEAWLRRALLDPGARAPRRERSR